MFKKIFTICACLQSLCVPATAQDINIVTDIPPIHSLVSMVYGESDNITLLFSNPTTAHDFSLRPSHAKALQKADIIFRIGNGLTPELDKPIDTFGLHGVDVELVHINGTHIIESSDDDHDDQDHSESHNDADHNHHEGYDPHLWLDPENAKLWINEISKKLIKVNPEATQTYQQNAQMAIKEIDKVIDVLSTDLAKYNEAVFIAMHDAFAYFSKRFDLTILDTLSPSDASTSSITQMQDFRMVISENNIRCLFTDPGSSVKQAKQISNDYNLEVTQVDPMGYQFEFGARQYIELLNDVSNSFINCAHLQ